MKQVGEIVVCIPALVRQRPGHMLIPRFAQASCSRTVDGPVGGEPAGGRGAGGGGHPRQAPAPTTGR